jgi:hypothetical protein
MGTFSFGTGWIYGKNHWSSEILVGLVPKYTVKKGSILDLRGIPTLTLKENYTPWNIRINSGIDFDPIYAGLYFNVLLNNKYWITTPAKYPAGYYFWSTKIRTLLFIGEGISFTLNHSSGSKRIALFYEISTVDLYIFSWMQNNSLKLSDYLGLSMGMRFQW